MTCICSLARDRGTSNCHPALGSSKLALGAILKLPTHVNFCNTQHMVKKSNLRTVANNRIYEFLHICLSIFFHVPYRQLYGNCKTPSLDFRRIYTSHI